MRRREFLGAAAAGAMALPRFWPHAEGSQGVADTLRRLPEVNPRDLTLTCRPGEAALGDGRVTRGWFYNGSMPGPVIRMTRGDRARVALVNDLPEETITHWHGLMVPEAADGHPRLAIKPGETYRYEFEVDQAPGLYWYHPHTHMRTATQVHAGLAGLLLVDDPASDPTGLPSSDREIPLVIQDRVIEADGSMPLPSRGPVMMMGFLGDSVLVNGTVNAIARVAPAAYRLRILNGSASRIYDLSLGEGVPMHVLGNDGGWLSAPAAVEHCLLAPAERLDVLVDFSRASGRTITLRSREFTLPEGNRGPMMGRGMMMMMGGPPQGAAMDMMRFAVDDTAPRAATVPTRLPGRSAPALPRGAHEQRFVFSSMGMNHTINGRSFTLTQPGVFARAGSVERWTFANDGPFPHPVHLHASQFVVRERRGGRGVVLPHEAGWKDTVLVAPSEEVTVDVHFARHRGLFLMHCHNLQHEDMGMMLNVQLD